VALTSSPRALAKSSIEQLGDVGVLQPRQDPPLGGEQPFHAALEDPRAHELDGHLLLEEAVVTLAEIDFAHAALAEQAGQAIGPDAFRRRALRDGLAGRRLGGQDAAGRLLGAQETSHAIRQFRFAGEGGGDPGLAPFWRLLQRRIQQFQHPPFGRGVHGD
jgi:hypothetical protein